METEKELLIKILKNKYNKDFQFVIEFFQNYKAKKYKDNLLQKYYLSDKKQVIKIINNFLFDEKLDLLNSLEFVLKKDNSIEIIDLFVKDLFFTPLEKQNNFIIKYISNDYCNYIIHKYQLDLNETVIYNQYYYSIKKHEQAKLTTIFFDLFLNFNKYSKILNSNLISLKYNPNIENDFYIIQYLESAPLKKLSIHNSDYLYFIYNTLKSIEKIDNRLSSKNFLTNIFKKTNYLYNTSIKPNHILNFIKNNINNFSQQELEDIDFFNQTHAIKQFIETNRFNKQQKLTELDINNFSENLKFINYSNKYLKLSNKEIFINNIHNSQNYDFFENYSKHILSKILDKKIKVLLEKSFLDFKTNNNIINNHRINKI